MANEIAWARNPTAKEDFTELQWKILEEAFESSSLVEILNWCTPSADGAFWNRKWKYVSMVAEAAQMMLSWGLIGVNLDDQPVEDDVARSLLDEPRNWWSFDPDDHSDEREWQALSEAGAVGYTEPPRITLWGSDTARSLF